MTKVADQQPKYIKVMIYLCFRDKSFKSLSHKLKTDGNVQLQTDWDGQADKPSFVKAKLTTQESCHVTLFV